MDLPNDVQYRDGSIAEVAVKFPAPYAAGHVLTEGEAAQLNQVLKENISNNLRDKIKTGIVQGEGENATTTPYDSTTAQALIDEYVKGYEPGVRRGGSGEARVTDPVEREARKIARQKAVELVKSRGMKPADVELGPIVDVIFEKNREVLMKEGKKIVAALEAAKNKSGDLLLDGLDFGAPATEEAAA